MPTKVYFEIAESSSKNHFNPFRTFDHREFLCGWCSAFVNIGVTYPVYKMIFRQVRILTMEFLTC
jgi:hypothetical protein